MPENFSQQNNDAQHHVNQEQAPSTGQVPSTQQPPSTQQTPPSQQPPAAYQASSPVVSSTPNEAPAQPASSFGSPNTSGQSSAPVPPASFAQSSQGGGCAGPSGTQTTNPQNTSPTPHRASARKQSGFKTFILGFLGAALAVAIGFGGFAVWQNSNQVPDSQDNGSATTLGSTAPSVIESGEDSTLAETVAAKALPSVACIYVYTEQSAYYNYFGFTFENPSDDSGSLVESSLGSGIVLTEDGYVLTNYHVVKGSDALKLNIEGTEYDAEVVGADESSDLAVVKAKDASGLTAADIGDSDELTVGEWVMTIGSPFGLEQSVATGVVSATSRSQIVDSNQGSPFGQGGPSAGAATIYPNMIQTDAAINPGNSGGALVDANGKVIGVNTLITSYSGNYSGVGFAIPINYAINLADQIIAGKTPTHAQLGVSMSTVNPTVAQRYGLAVDSGAYVALVNDGSGAKEAGIEAGDIITAVDDKDITSASDLMLEIRAHNPGDTVTITLNRDGETKELEVVLGSDENTAAAQEQPKQENNTLSPLID